MQWGPRTHPDPPRCCENHPQAYSQAGWSWSLAGVSLELRDIIGHLLLAKSCVFFLKRVSWWGEPSSVLTELSALLRGWTHPWASDSESKELSRWVRTPGTLNPGLLPCSMAPMFSHVTLGLKPNNLRIKNSTGPWSRQNTARAEVSELDKKCRNTVFSNLRYMWTLQKYFDPGGLT